MRCTLGIDVGTSGTKAVVIDESGATAGSATVPYPLHSPRPNWAEQHPEDWWAATLEAIERAVAGSAVGKDDVGGIGLTGQMHGSVFLDKNSAVLRPAILWCDQRTATECDEITDKVGAEDLIQHAGNPALTGFTAPKILWLRNNELENYKKVWKVLLPKDYIRYRLTGELNTEVSDASGTLLFDVAQRQWSDTILERLDIPRDFLPDSVESPEVTGTLSQEIADRVGLKPGIPVVGGGGDQAAGGIGNGIVRKGLISSTIGTSGVVFAFAEEGVRDPQGRLHSFCHAVPGKWHLMGVMLAAGGSLQWFRNNFAAAEMEVALLAHKDPYELMTAEAEKAPAGCEGLIFLPYLTGERTPHADPDAKAVFFGLSLRHNKGHLIRAVMEGVVFGLRDSFEIMEGMGIAAEEPVRISGGGARSPLWRQIHADVIQTPVATLNVTEGPAFGAALLAHVGCGTFSSVEEACDATISVVDVTEPQPEMKQLYEDAYRVYQGLYPSLKKHFREIAGLV